MLGSTAHESIHKAESMTVKTRWAEQRCILLHDSEEVQIREKISRFFQIYIDFFTCSYADDGNFNHVVI